MSREKPDAPGRRQFLKGLAAAGGAAALLATGEQAMASEAGPGEGNNPSEGGKGYRLSEHVKAYYRTLRI